MPAVLTPACRRRLDIQGFEHVDDDVLAPVARWLRLALALCTLFAATGTLMASPTMLLSLAAVAAVAAVSPVHPFDLIYNWGIRFATGTGPLPRRGAPARFGCGIGAVWLSVTAWAFHHELTVLGYLLGGLLTSLATLVSTTDICVPSLVYRVLFGFPAPRPASVPQSRQQTPK